MFFRKSFALLTLTAVALYMFDTASATPLPDPPYETSTTTSSWGGTWNSNISCSSTSGSNVIEEGAVTLDQNVNCTISNRVDGDGNPLSNLSGACALHVEYVNIPATCDGGTTLTNNLLCSSLTEGNITTASTLNCNPDGLETTDPNFPEICEGNKDCTAQIGAPPPTGNKWSQNDCKNVFGSADAVILNSVVETVGPNCTGAISDLGQISAQYCTSGTLTDPSADPNCIASGNSPKNASKIAGTVDLTLPITIGVSPTTVNVACGGNKDNGNIRVFIYGEESVDVTLIDTSTLELEGVAPENCDTGFVNEDNFLDLICEVASCPTLGNTLAEKRGDSSTVTVVVTGELKDGTPIEGETVINTSPSPK